MSEGVWFLIVAVIATTLALTIVSLANSNDTSTLVEKVNTESTEMITMIKSLVNPVEAFSVWADSDLGDDSNAGTSAGSPVKTLQRAIEVLETTVAADSCMIYLSGISPFYLGNGTTLDFSVVERRCQKVVIKGTRENVVSDTVAALNPIEPFGAWSNVVGESGNYAEDYTEHFVENLDRGYVYVVRNNSAGDFDTIAGDVDNIPSFDVDRKSWVVGERYELFKVSTTITWIGDLDLVIPKAGEFLIFDSLILDPEEDESPWNNPFGFESFVEFRGCRMITKSTTSGTYRGSMYLRGVFIDGMTNVLFNSDLYDSRLRAISVWSQSAGINWSGDGYACFVYATQGTFVTLTSTAGFFAGYGLFIEDPTDWGLQLINALTFRVARVKITGIKNFDRGVLLQSSQGLINFIDIRGDNNAFGIVAIQTDMRLSGFNQDINYIECGRPILLEDDAHVSAFGTDLITTTGAGVAGGIRVRWGSKFTIISTMTITSTSNAVPVISETGSTVLIKGGLTVTSDTFAYRVGRGSTIQWVVQSPNQGTGPDIDFCTLGSTAHPVDTIHDPVWECYFTRI